MQTMTEHDVVRQIVQNLLTTEVTEDRFVRAVYEFSKHFIVIKPTAKTRKFIAEFNLVMDEAQLEPIAGVEVQVGTTVEELFLKAIAFSREDPLSYIKKRACVIPRSEAIDDFINSRELAFIMTRKPDDTREMENPLGGSIPLFTSTTSSRLQKRFEEIVAQQFPLITCFKVGRSALSNILNGKVYVCLTQYFKFDDDVKLTWRTSLQDHPKMGDFMASTKELGKFFFGDTDVRLEFVEKVHGIPRNMDETKPFGTLFYEDVLVQGTDFRMGEHTREHLGIQRKNKELKGFGTNSNVAHVVIGIFFSADRFYNITTQVNPTFE